MKEELIKLAEIRINKAEDILDKARRFVTESKKALSSLERQNK